MRKRTLHTLIALALVASVSGLAMAQTPDKPSGPARTGWLAHDSNGDGRVQRSEVQDDARLSARFQRMDRDNDGVLAGNELQRPRMGGGHRHRGADRAGRRGWHGQAAGMHAHADADRDGRISAAEWQASFAARDLNKDGFIDQADRQLRGQQQRQKWFAAADTDGDGKLSPAELEAAGKGAHGQRDGLSLIHI